MNCSGMWFWIYVLWFWLILLAMLRYFSIVSSRSVIGIGNCVVEYPYSTGLRSYLLCGTCKITSEMKLGWILCSLWIFFPKELVFIHQFFGVYISHFFFNWSVLLTQFWISRVITWSTEKSVLIHSSYLILLISFIFQKVCSNLEFLLYQRCKQQILP